MNFETVSSWGSRTLALRWLANYPFRCVWWRGELFFKNEAVIRKLVRHSYDVMSKRHGKKVKVSSAPPLQIAEYINSIKAKQENFELKLEQGNVNFQHIGNSRRQRGGQNPGGSEVSQRD